LPPQSKGKVQRGGSVDAGMKNGMIEFKGILEVMFNSIGQAYVAFEVSRSSTVRRIQPLSNWIAQPSSLTSLPYSTVKASGSRGFSATFSIPLRKAVSQEKQCKSLDGWEL
jgi:hypothetical protein